MLTPLVTSSPGTQGLFIGKRVAHMKSKNNINRTKTSCSHKQVLALWPKIKCSSLFRQKVHQPADMNTHAAHPTECNTTEYSYRTCMPLIHQKIFLCYRGKQAPILVCTYHFKITILKILFSSRRQRASLFFLITQHEFPCFGVLFVM